MGNKDDFPTLLLTRRLIKGGVLKALNNEERGHINLKKGGKRRQAAESDDDEDY